MIPHIRNNDHAALSVTGRMEKMEKRVALKGEAAVQAVRENKLRKIKVVDANNEHIVSLANMLAENTSLVALDVSENNVADSGATAIANALTINSALTTLEIRDNLIGSDGFRAIAMAIKRNSVLTMLDVRGNSNVRRAVRDIVPSLTINHVILAQALVAQYLTLKCLMLQVVKLEEDTQSLPKSGILEQIPVDVLDKGINALIAYLLALKVTALRCRSKVLVVGFQGAGKTSLLNALQPVQAFVRMPGFLGTKPRVAVVDATGLRIFENDQIIEPRIQVTLSNRWHLQVKGNRISLTPPKYSTERELIMETADGDETSDFVNRLRFAVHNTATHGIAVRRFIASGTENQPLEIFAWDFAGQHEYYNSHHHFLSDQALYVVVWDVTKQGHDDASNALLFWLRSLRVQLPPPGTSSYARAAIVIVGTHIDMLPLADQAASSQARQLRNLFVRNTAEKAGLQWPLTITEVSTMPPAMSGIADLRQEIFKLAGQLAGDGQLVPQSYLDIECAVDLLTNRIQSRAVLPVVRMQDVLDAAQRFEKLEDNADNALSQLNSWGRIVYQPDIVDLIILSPAFLTQEAMGELFRPSHQFMKNGQLKKSDLSHIWSNTALAPYREDLLQLMERFDVCYAQGGTIVFPALLDMQPPSTFSQQWPETPDGDEVELCRVFSLDVLPSHLISRVLSRLHTRIHLQIVWRHGAVLDESNRTLGLLRLDADGIGGRLIVRVRPFKNDRRAGMRLLADIVVVVKDCISLYPGVVVEELLECTSEKCSACFMPVATAAAAMEQEAIRCLKNRGVSPRRLLEHAGLIGAAPDSAVAASLSYNNDLVAIMMRLNYLEGALRTVIQQIDQCNYPCLFILVPADKPTAWLAKLKDRAERLAFNKLRLLPLCEFAMDEHLCHPTGVAGMDVADLKQKELVERLGAALKVTSYILRAVQLGVKIAGIPFPDVASALSDLVDLASNAQDSVSVLRGKLDDVSSKAVNTDVQLDRRRQAPQRLRGRALGDVEALFGRNLV